MKQSMAVQLLVAGVCALGTVAAAQTDMNPNPANQQPGNTETPPTESPSSAGNDASAAAPDRNMRMSEKKRSIENIKKAIRDSETNQGKLSGRKGTSAEAGSMSSKPMGVKHLKVFRRGDKVVVRGMVRSQEEKDRIGSVAEGAASGQQIINELKVK